MKRGFHTPWVGFACLTALLLSVTVAAQQIPPDEPRSQQVEPRQVDPRQIQPQLVRPQQIQPQQIQPQQIDPERFQVRPQRIPPEELRRSGAFPMPGVVGMTVPQAERAVLEAGRAVGARSARAVVRIRDDGRPEGEIVEQVERPGQAMRPYMDDVGGVYGQVTFNVIVSRGPRPAPRYLGMTVPQAQRDATGRKLRLLVGESVPDSRTQRGIIIRQEPEPGQPMREPVVSVQASDGFPLPDLRRRPLEEARRRADELGFELELRAEERFDVPEGMVFDQRPAPGTLLPLREPVTLLVSRGWPVPNLLNRPLPAAEPIAGEIRARLAVTEQDSPEVPVGVIFAQDPAPGSPLPRDRVIRVTVSGGFPLPSLVGRDQPQAEAIAERLGFELQARRTPLPNRARDLIDSQVPAAGARLPLDEPVRVTISDGWRTPEFLGQEEEAAFGRARERQVSLTVAGRRQDRDATPGTVIEQRPAAGTLLPPGQPVEVVLSGGFPTPSFLELGEEEALDLAAGERIVLDISRRESLDHPAGVVLDQDPQPGAPLPADGRVAVTVSGDRPTPDFLGRTETQAVRIARDNRVTLQALAPREDYKRERGLVVEQQPAPGVPLPRDRSVSLVYSLGWPVAPDAVGDAVDELSARFLARHPNARVELEERFLTLQPVGSVLSQRPAPDEKLGPDQRLVLIAVVAKPVWVWGALGLFVLGGGLAVFQMIRALGRTQVTEADADADTGPTQSEQAADLAEDPSGIHLRVTKDFGSQSVREIDDEGRSRAEAEEPLRLRVLTDLGRQSVEPADGNEGDEE